MASGSTSSVLGSLNETHNGMKLMKLVLDGGTEALRKVFKRIHPGNLQVVLCCKSSPARGCGYSADRGTDPVVRDYSYSRWVLLLRFNPDRTHSVSVEIAWGIDYICLHESGLSCNSFRIEFIPFFIPD